MPEGAIAARTQQAADTTPAAHAARTVAMVVINLQALARTATDGTHAALHANHGIELGRSQAMHPAPRRGAGIVGTEDALAGSGRR